MRQLFLRALSVLAFAAIAVPGAAQAPDSAPKAGTVFVQAGVSVTTLLHDTQDIGSGYLHFNFIGQLDWPAAGAAIGGGVFVARRLSAGTELAFRHENVATLQEAQHAHVEEWHGTGLFSSRERLLSFVVRWHASPAGHVDVQPLGGVTWSTATRTLTGQQGVYNNPGFPSRTYSRPDATLSETRPGLVGGADFVVHMGGGVACLIAPRWQWIHRQAFDSYTHTVPNAARNVLSVAFGVQWRAPRRR